MKELVTKIVKKFSEKKGTEYYVIEIQLTPTYSKTVFLDKAEIELLKAYNIAK